MRAHNVIIICSGQGHLSRTDVLNQTVKNILNLKKTPILVLGPDGDDFVEHCQEIEKCEIVFDPNFEGRFFSGVKAGLHATNGAAFVVPLSEKSADSAHWAVWVTMEKLLIDPNTSLGADVVWPVTREADFLPRLITSRGVTSLKKLPSTTDWESSDQIVGCSLYLGNKDC